MDKPEALQLADALMEAHPYPLDIKNAAAELRRLHKENELLASAADKLRMVWRDEVHCLMQDKRQLIAQRDALLEACRFYASMMGRRKSDGEPFYMTPLDFDCGDRARAAIKAVEGEKNHG